jgi:UDP:flavonoid glycosyltransferase YjiC (YdhE family)
MRLLFSFAGGSGHAEPLVPIARAVVAAGHEVAFAGQRAAIATLGGHGFALFPDPGHSGEGPGRIAPLVSVDMEREFRVLREAYGGRFARRAMHRFPEVNEAWRPDVVVCDEVDFGSMIAAERLGVPHATVLVTAAGSFIRPDVLAEPLDALRVEHGLPPDPDLAMLGRHLVISPMPRSFRDPSCPPPPNTLSIRPEAANSARTDDGRPWTHVAPDVPVVYFTLGTVFNWESGDLFARVIAGLRVLPIELVVTVGRDLDTAFLGSQPQNVHVERYVSQSDVLPHCAAAVNHGGSGSVIGSLAHGVPMVLLPMGADQPLNAARCEALGVGRALGVMAATPSAIADRVTAVLEEPAYRLAAERIRDEIAELPGPAETVPLLEELANASR